MASTYSGKWFQTFCAGFDEAQTAREAAFLKRVLPLPTHSRLLDIGCGLGRHALALSRLGFDVTGLEANAKALEAARVNCGESVRLLPGDMRDLRRVGREFDAAICMWATFGLFDPEDNTRVLAGMAQCLRPGGRLVLDVYDPQFSARSTEQPFERNGMRGLETSTIRDGRRFVRLTYAGSADVDEFDWQLFTVDELGRLSAQLELELVLSCSDFSESTPARGHSPRMQLVFEKRS